MFCFGRFFSVFLQEITTLISKMDFLHLNLRDKPKSPNSLGLKMWSKIFHYHWIVCALFNKGFPSCFICFEWYTHIWWDKCAKVFSELQNLLSWSHGCKLFSTRIVLAFFVHGFPGCCGLFSEQQEAHYKYQNSKLLLLLPVVYYLCWYSLN